MLSLLCEHQCQQQTRQRTLSRHYSVANTPDNACPIPAMTNCTDLDRSSDTLTYTTENQTAPLHVPSKPVQCTPSHQKSSSDL